MTAGKSPGTPENSALPFDNLDLLLVIRVKKVRGDHHSGHESCQICFIWVVVRPIFSGGAKKERVPWNVGTRRVGIEWSG
jgi:hypothetical protein